MDNVGFVREFQNSVYGDDGYENAQSKLAMPGHFVANDSYSKVDHYGDTTQKTGISDNDDSYADPNEFRASRSNVSPELIDNPLYQVVEESNSNGDPEYGMLDKERNGPEGPVESRPRRNKSSTSAEEYSELER